MTDISRILAAWAPATESERICQRFMLALAARGPETASRAHYKPAHFTSSCYIVHIATGALLLHRHPRLGEWLPVGGHIESGESPMQAALREAREESGLVALELLGEGALSIDIHPIPATDAEPAHQHYDIAFAATVDWATPPVITAPGTFVWLPLVDAAARASSRGVKRAVERLALILPSMGFSGEASPRAATGD